jgi:hypothetical protein
MAFVKRTIIIQGRQIPAIQIGQPVNGWGTRSDGRPVFQTIAECLSLRTTNPVDANGNPQEVQTYYTTSPENLRFTPVRFSNVEGLDVENGSALGIDVLMQRVTDNIAERQMANLANTVAPVVSLDDEDETVATGETVA